MSRSCSGFSHVWFAKIKHLVFFSGPWYVTLQHSRSSSPDWPCIKSTHSHVKIGDDKSPTRWFYTTEYDSCGKWCPLNTHTHTHTHMLMCRLRHSTSTVRFNIALGLTSSSNEWVQSQCAGRTQAQQYRLISHKLLHSTLLLTHLVQIHSLERPAEPQTQTRWGQYWHEKQSRIMAVTTVWDRE